LIHQKVKQRNVVSENKIESKYDHLNERQDKLSGTILYIVMKKKNVVRISRVFDRWSSPKRIITRLDLMKSAINQSATKYLSSCVH